MSVINSQPLIGASGNQSTAYNLTRSLRFRSSASAYLNRTPASSGNRQTWTFSAWVKRGTLGSDTYIMSGGSSANPIFEYTQILFDSSNRLVFNTYNNQNGVEISSGWLTTTQVFRDTSAWYHIVVNYNSTNATSTNRMKIFVNGAEVTSFTTGTFPTTYPAQNTNSYFNSNSYAMNVGKAVNGATANHFDGYLAEVNFVDGQALTPSDFGETDTATGVWKPKKYTGTYGTNGFYLKFDNLTSTSTLGNDSSGNSNTWTVNNISLTSGSTYDSMKDVPTLTDADTANYCVLNPLNNLSTAGSRTIDNGNLRFFSTSASQAVAYSSINLPTTGKFYYEVLIDSAGATSTTTNIYCGGANYYQNGTSNGSTAYGASWTTNDIIGVAVDIDTGSVTFYKNNSSQGARTGLSPANDFSFACNFDGSNRGCSINFGQQPFSYTPPSGFKALNTFNLPTPTIGATASSQANKYFDVPTWTGNTAQRNISTNCFADFVWIKDRTAANNNVLFDSVRGSNKQLVSNSTAAELDPTLYGYVSQFNSTNFQLSATAGDYSNVNQASDAYVGWVWQAGQGTTSTNNDGNRTSTVSVNATAGFSVVTYTFSTSGTNTVGHGLGVAPAFIIMKDRTNTYNWDVYHQSVGYTNRLVLNSTAAAASGFWDSTPTSTTFSVTSSMGSNNDAIVAYCFAEVAGYSKFGSYTGNGSADGPFVFTGFRPKFLMVKRTDTTGNWIIDDAVRNTSNIVDLELYPNLSNAESSDPSYDFLSNGFKLRVTSSNKNASGGTYIFMALAENPFKYSLAR